MALLLLARKYANSYKYAKLAGKGRAHYSPKFAGLNYILSMKDFKGLLQGAALIRPSAEPSVLVKAFTFVENRYFALFPK